MPVSPEHLQSVPLLSGLGRKDLARLAKQMRERTLAAGKEAVVQGEQASGFFVILSGEAEVTVDGEHRRTLGPGDYFGEVALLAPEAIRTATVTATTRCRWPGWTSWQFRPLVLEQPEMAWSLLQTMAKSDGLTASPRAGAAAAIRSSLTAAAERRLRSRPVTAVRKRSRSSPRRTTPSPARTVAVRGMSRSSAISPKPSAGPERPHRLVVDEHVQRLPPPPGRSGRRTRPCSITAVPRRRPRLHQAAREPFGGGDRGEGRRSECARSSPWTPRPGDGLRRPRRR